MLERNVLRFDSEFLFFPTLFSGRPGHQIHTTLSGWHVIEFETRTVAALRGPDYADLCPDASFITFLIETIRIADMIHNVTGVL